MDQMKDSIADQHRRRRLFPTKFRCFLGCFGGGASEEHQKSQRKPKSKSHNRWFSWSKLRNVKFPTRTVPVESASDKNVNHEKGSALRSNSKSSKMISSYDELPVKGDEEIQSQPPPVAGDIRPGKANKTRSGKGLYLRNSKSMNHLQLEDMKDSSTCTKGEAATSLKKSKSAKISTDITVELSQSVANQPLLPTAITGGGGGNNGVDNKVKKTDDQNKGSFDRVVGISIIVMVLLIMAIWGKLCAILCSSAWLYFYPLLKSNYINNKNGQDAGQTKKSKSIDVLNTNSQLQKKKVVFQGFLQRDHQII